MKKFIKRNFVFNRLIKIYWFSKYNTDPTNVCDAGTKRSISIWLWELILIHAHKCCLFFISLYNVQHLSVFISFTSCFPIMFITTEAKFSLLTLSCWKAFFFFWWADNLGDLPFTFGFRGNIYKHRLWCNSKTRKNSSLSVNINKNSLYQKVYLIILTTHFHISINIFYW